jgi:hypothetical protein
MFTKKTAIILGLIMAYLAFGGFAGIKIVDNFRGLVIHNIDQIDRITTQD